MLSLVFAAVLAQANPPQNNAAPAPPPALRPLPEPAAPIVAAHLQSLGQDLSAAEAEDVATGDRLGATLLRAANATYRDATRAGDLTRTDALLSAVDALLVAVNTGNTSGPAYVDAANAIGSDAQTYTTAIGATYGNRGGNAALLQTANALVAGLPNVRDPLQRAAVALRAQLVARAAAFLAVASDPTLPRPAAPAPFVDLRARANAAASGQTG